MQCLHSRFVDARNGSCPLSARPKRRSAHRPSPPPEALSSTAISGRVLIDAALGLAEEGGPTRPSALREAGTPAPGCRRGATVSATFPSRVALMTAVAEEAQRRAFRAEIDVGAVPRLRPATRWARFSGTWDGLFALGDCVTRPHFEIISNGRFFRPRQGNRAVTGQRRG